MTQNSLLYLSSRRVTARGDSCKEAIGEINLPFLPLSVPLYINPSLIRGTPSYKMYPNRRVHEDNQHLPSSLYTTNILISPRFLHDKARNRRVDTSSYRNELISNSELQNSDSKTNLKSINPPSLKTSNNSRILQTSTTLENHRQVKTTILFSKMHGKWRNSRKLTRKILYILKI